MFLPGRSTKDGDCNCCKGLRDALTKHPIRSPMGESFREPPSPSGAPTNAPQLLLNGFRLSLSSDTLSANTLPLPDNKPLRDLRRAHPDWFLYWRDGTLYAIPRVDSPTTSIGTETPLTCNDHLQLVTSLIDEALPK